VTLSFSERASYFQDCPSRASGALINGTLEINRGSSLGVQVISVSTIPQVIKKGAILEPLFSDEPDRHFLLCDSCQGLTRKITVT